MEEVTCVRGYDQFTNVLNYVRSGVGYKLVYTKSRAVNQIKKFKRVTHNARNTFFCIPKTSGENQGTCFKLFSILDLHEFKYIQEKIDKKEVIKVVDSESVVAEIFQNTIF